MCIGIDKSRPLKDQCGILCKKFDTTCKDWQLGLTKVFAFVCVCVCVCVLWVC